MNIIDNLLARIPINEVMIKTTINSYAVIERIDRSGQPDLIIPEGHPTYTVESEFDGNYFKVRGKLFDEKGNEQFPSPTLRLFGIAILLPIRIDPVFHGRVFDDGDRGSTIYGNFGLPFSILLLLCALALLLAGKLYPRLAEDFTSFTFFLVLVSVFNFPQFYSERSEVVDFLKGLFFDVIRKE
jgi:hypothetical protein